MATNSIKSSVGILIIIVLGFLFYKNIINDTMGDETNNKLYEMKDFFRNPEKSSFNISPNGKHIAYMKPWKEGNRMMNIYVKDINMDKEIRLTKASERSIYGFFWINDDRIAYIQDKGGNENYSIYAVNINGSDEVNLTPFDDVKAQIIDDLTDGIGADGVIITASTTSNELISQSAQMCRKRGRVVLVGVIGLNINRADFYEKEITFQVSCSYGPGRYDQNFEQNGLDYPIGYVRWTEKRNFEAVLNAISNGLLNFKPLITQEVSLQDYQLIYSDLSNSKSIATIINFEKENKNIISDLNTVAVSNKKFKIDKPVIGIIGAGNFTSSMILPILNKLGVQIKCIASSTGLSGTVLAKKYNINFSTSDYKKIINDNDINAAIITTKHNSHAKLVIESLDLDKHVFVEKPLAINNSELEQIKKSYKKSKGSLMVGFNRRFSPLSIISKDLIGIKETPINVVSTMNAGYIPKESWVQDLKVGGGRIIGEACHYIDLISYLTGSKVIAVTMSGLGKNPNYNSDNAIITLKYENGSQGVINYFSNGNKSYPKERIEIFDSGKNIIIVSELFGIQP